ncbi:MAG: ankyrin repeat domain-containing protein [Burkholderiales bacterium]
MKHDDGDFTDPASRVPWARPPAPGGAANARAAMRTAGSVARGRPRAGFLGSLIGLAIVLGILAVVHGAAFGDWNQAPEVPFRHGLGHISIGRILVPVVDVLLLWLFFAYRRAGEDGAAAVSKRGARVALLAALLVFGALEATGALRSTVIKVFGKVPGGSTRLQSFERARLDSQEQAPRYMGEAQPAPFYEGIWRRHGLLYPNDVRRIEVRRAGDGFRVRVWIECDPGKAPCDAGEVPARVAAAAGGRIASLTAELPNADGRVWFMLFPARAPMAQMAISTQVYFEVRPEWKVSSSPGAAMVREKPGRSAADFAGEFDRAAAGAAREFTRLAVRQTGPRELSVRAWMMCAPRNECDLGEKPALVELDPAGRVVNARAKFSREQTTLEVALEPPADGTFEAEIVFTRFGTVRGSITRRGGSTSQSVDTERARVKLVRRAEGAALAPPRSAVPALVTPPSSAQAAASPAVSSCSDARMPHDAARLGCALELSRILLAAPGQLEARNAAGLTPLAEAVRGGHHAAAEMLLKVAADANAAVRFAPGAAPRVGGQALAERAELSEGSTPLMLARDAAMVALLLRYGAETGAKNKYGWSPIFYFTRNGSTDMLEALLAGGANINVTADVDPSHAGTTALMWAAYMNRLPQLTVLLRHGARTDLRDRAGKTALDYARGFGHKEAIALLERHNRPSAAR